MIDEEANELNDQLLNTDEAEALLLQKITPPDNDVSYYISETIWSSVSWQLEVAKRIMNYSNYSLPIFDVIYLGLLILEITVNYQQWSAMHGSGGIPFQVFFAILFWFNIFAPPMGLHLIQSILLNPDMPIVFQQATKFDNKFHFRMHCLAYLNCAVSLLAVLLSFFTNPLYRSVQLPFLCLYVLAISFTLSVVVVLLEGHRLLACQFVHSLEDGEFHEYCSVDNTSTSRQSSTSSTSTEQGYTLSRNNVRGTPTPTPTRINISHPPGRFSCHHSRGDILKLRNDYYALHLRFDVVRKNWGLYILFVIVALMLITVGLVWYSYISDFNRVKFSLVLPYIIITMFGACQLLFSLTLVNEMGAKVSKSLAKYIFKYHGQVGLGVPGGESSSTMADINNLLILSQIVLIEIPFVEGFTLRVKLTAMLVGPLIGSILPKLVAR